MHGGDRGGDGPEVFPTLTICQHIHPIVYRIKAVFVCLVQYAPIRAVFQIPQAGGKPVSNKVLHEHLCQSEALGIAIEPRVVLAFT